MKLYKQYNYWLGIELIWRWMFPLLKANISKEADWSYYLWVIRGLRTSSLRWGWHAKHELPDRQQNTYSNSSYISKSLIFFLIVIKLLGQLQGSLYYKVNLIRYLCLLSKVKVTNNYIISLITKYKLRWMDNFFIEG